MTSEAARRILSAYPGGQGGDNPEVAAAIERARRDPELLAWFQEQQAFDAAVRGKLSQVPVPEHLLRDLLAGRRERARVAGWRPWAWAAAALVMVGAVWLILGGGRPEAGSEFATWRAEMTRFLVQFPRLDLDAEAWPEIERWLEARSAGRPTTIPAGFRRYPGLGCRELRWRDRSVMLVCFVAEGEVMHLFVLSAAPLEGVPKATTPDVERVAGWNTAAWSSGGVGYVILTRGSDELLSRLLGPLQRG